MAKGQVEQKEAKTRPLLVYLLESSHITITTVPRRSDPQGAASVGFARQEPWAACLVALLPQRWLGQMLPDLLQSPISAREHSTASFGTENKT